MEDMKSSDLDLTVRTLLRLTRAVAKQVDTAIYNCATENDTPVNINTVATTAAWDAASGQDIIEDLMDAKYQIRLYSYNPEGASLWLSPKDYKSMVTWLISSKGASIPNFSSDKLASGTVMQILGLNVKVSNNVTADKAVVIIPQKAVTWKSFQDITSRAIEEQGIGTKFRVFQLGVPLLTDPRAVCLITNTQT